MQTMLGFSALESGMALLPGAVLMGLMNPVTGRLFDKFGAKWLAVIGLSIVTVTTFMFTVLTPETTFAYIAIVNGIRMFGISMEMMSLTRAGLYHLITNVLQHGTDINNTLRQVVGAVGTALLVAVMTTNEIPDHGVRGLIRGGNVSFIVDGIVAVIALI